MQENNEPLPGLLYEADVQTGHSFRSRRQQNVEGFDDGGVGAPFMVRHGIANSSIDPADSSASTISPMFNNSSSSHDNHQILETTQEESALRVTRPTGVSTDDEERVLIMKGGVVKLGLGDFVFYSVLVSRASMFGFVEFITCFLIVLSGLGATLVLLTLYKIPLPALPFSILFGFFFYLMTRFFVTPFLQNCSSIPVYM